MSTYVVDASVAAKWLMPEAHTQEARRLLAGLHELRAPDLFWLEMHGIVCQRIRRKAFPRQEGLRILSALHSFPIQIFPSADLLANATAIALGSAIGLYDCIYVALAVLLDAPMVTADRRLLQGLAGGPLAPYVLWVEDIP